MRAWGVRVGEDRERERAALEDGVLIIGWRGLGDLGGTTRDEVRAAVAGAYPGEGPYTIGNWAGQIHRFVNEIAAGDLVVMPLKSGVVNIGRVVGDYAYRPEAEEGTRHTRRVEWLVRDIDRGAFRPDLLSSLGSLLTVFELGRYGAAERVGVMAGGKLDPGDPEADELAAELTGPTKLVEEVRGRSAEDSLELSVRDFLAVWDVRRRSPEAIKRITADLRDKGLITVPPFTEGSLDSRVTILAGGSEPDESGKSAVTRTAEDAKLPEDVRNAARAVRGQAEEDTGPRTVVAYRVSNLESANRMPEGVRVGDDLRKAVTIMARRNYSQVPVLDAEGRLRGVVSWESVGRARMRTPNPDLEAATGPRKEVGLSEDLLEAIGTIQRFGYVFVHDHEHRVRGLITASDLAEQFGSRVRPFVLVEEIEQRLRLVVDRHLPLDRVRKVVRNGGRVKSVDNLNFGAYKYVFEEEENWAALGWDIDRNGFIEDLEECRRFRNSLMHFSPDPITDDQLTPLQDLLDLLRTLEPQD
ncbi:CBS domain-containing protein [Streptomyces alkaliphilus]|uniref:CBS domain-containing protein n=1 Tax=Streptomyces alkaliphilus TaxID=1472722 RepID=A0A7W3Y171_9ACTN|nr:CBS domain-containing protein [Streptomyces alkaliphilus]MBB0244228.1 CBS domain-containing protein [Streptomyces alkaliphilus]